MTFIYNYPSDFEGYRKRLLNQKFGLAARRAVRGVKGTAHKRCPLCHFYVARVKPNGEKFPWQKMKLSNGRRRLVCYKCIRDLVEKIHNS